MRLTPLALALCLSACASRARPASPPTVAPPTVARAAPAPTGPDAPTTPEAPAEPAPSPEADPAASADAATPPGAEPTPEEPAKIDTRDLVGTRVVHVGDDPLAALPLLAHLRRGGVVALQLDRVLPGARTLAVRLFGEAAELPAGPFLLAAASGAPVLPVFARRLGLLRYAVRVCPPVSVERGASPAVMGEAAGAAAAELEGFVRAYPTHWFPFG